jgi:hypothetical protein
MQILKGEGQYVLAISLRSYRYSLEVSTRKAFIRISWMMKALIFWDITPRSLLKVTRLFGPHQHSRSWFQVPSGPMTIFLFFPYFTCYEMGPPLWREESDDYCSLPLCWGVTTLPPSSGSKNMLSKKTARSRWQNTWTFAIGQCPAIFNPPRLMNHTDVLQYLALSIHSSLATRMCPIV